MNKSISAMSDIERVCAVLRANYFGANATSSDFKDSYIVNEAISRFSASAESLMEGLISDADNEKNKAAKSLNLRSEVVDKIISYASVLAIPESEVVRRILYYSILKESSPAEISLNLSQVRKELAEIRSQLQNSVRDVDRILVHLNSISISEKEVQRK